MFNKKQTKSMKGGIKLYMNNRVYARRSLTLSKLMDRGSADDSIDNLSMLGWINYCHNAAVSIKNTVILWPLIICVKMGET